MSLPSTLPVAPPESVPAPSRPAPGSRPRRGWALAAAFSAGVAAAALGGMAAPRAASGFQSTADGRVQFKLLKRGNIYFNQFLISYIRDQKDTDRLVVNFQGAGNQFEMSGDDAKAIRAWLEISSLELQTAPGGRQP